MTVIGSSLVSLDLAATEARESRAHRSSAVVVLATGCFDLLHPGHVHLLREARAAGNREKVAGTGRLVPPVFLIVALNDDESVRRLKGPGRPIFTLEERALLLDELADVDLVTSFEGDDPSTAIEALQPDLYVKGGDYDPATLPEAPLVERLGGRAITVSRPEGSWSTTNILSRASRGRVR